MFSGFTSNVQRDRYFLFGCFFFLHRNRRALLLRCPVFALSPSRELFLKLLRRADCVACLLVFLRLTFLPVDFPLAALAVTLQTPILITWFFSLATHAELPDTNKKNQKNKRSYVPRFLFAGYFDDPVFSSCSEMCVTFHIPPSRKRFLRLLLFRQPSQCCLRR